MSAHVVESVVLLVAVAGAYIAQLVRWLRVLQREHYEPGSVRRFVWRWATASSSAAWWKRATGSGSLTLWGVALSVVLLFLGLDYTAVAVAALVGVLCPLGLSTRGRTGKLAWTRRLRTLTVVAVIISSLVALSALVIPRPWVVAVMTIVLVPFVLDAAALLTRPYESRAAQRFVDRAQERLRTIDPTVVAITGSYGKTSTKHHLAEILGGRRGVVPSPRSYNNRAGLSRAINENLADGTKIFIAEMGTYGPGEIADLTSWCTPDVAVVTAIGPVHLERMKSLDVIERAKFEITQRAPMVIINIDDERLAGWVDTLTSAGKTVRTAGCANPRADVRVLTVNERWQIVVDGDVAAIAPPVAGVRESNLACAIAASLALGLTIDEVVARFPHLTSVPNRMVVATAPSGVMVIDDTFNANPAGARAALQTLRDLPLHGQRVVVTPGMVELGREQRRENEILGRMVKDMDARLLVVGLTNAAALETGYGVHVTRFATRDGAVDWVRANLTAGDGVLYLNDLPDQYP